MLVQFFSGAELLAYQKRSRDESKPDEPVTTPVGAKKAKEEDVKPDVKKAKPESESKSKKARKPKEPRVLRHFPLSPIAHPLATAEQQAALFALLEKAAKAKQLRRGVKEIQKVSKGVRMLVCAPLTFCSAGASQEGDGSHGAGRRRGAAGRDQPPAGAV